MENNSLSSLHVSYSGESIFQNLIKLDSLFLNTNKLKILTNAFKNNHNLLELHIYENPQLILNDDSFTGLHQLKKLYIDNCNIYSLPKYVFINTPSLSHLYIYNNSLTNTDLTTLEILKHLQELDLSCNNIAELKDQPFKNNINLKYIDLAKNEITEIENDSFSELYNLTHIDLSWNFIGIVFENSFGDLYLETLDIAHNLLTSLPMSTLFRNNTNLNSIDASHNHLDNFTDLKLDHLPELEKIDISNNKFTEIVLSSRVIPETNCKFYLKSNFIRIIHVKETENITGFHTNKKTQIYFNENPLNCDCHAYVLHNSVNSSDVLQLVEFVDGLIFKHPPKNQEK